MNPRLFPRRAAFTLTELLVVIAIVGVLAGLLIPVVGLARDRARVVECQSNLRQVHLGLTLYLQEHRDLLPGPLTGAQPSLYSTDPNQQNALASHLAPYQGLPLDGTTRRNRYLLCPAHAALMANPKADERSYGIPTNSNMGYPFGYSSSNRVEPKRLGDYLANRKPGVFWALRDTDQEASSSNSYVTLTQVHKGGHNYLFFDGGVRMLSPDQEKALNQKIASGG